MSPAISSSLEIGLIINSTGAKEVLTFTHRIRCFATDEEKLANNRSPAHSVHLDFTVPGALQHLEAVLQDPKRVKEALRGRVMVINVWRPLRKIKRDPLTVCDWRSASYRREPTFALSGLASLNSRASPRLRRAGRGFKTVVA